MTRNFKTRSEILERSMPKILGNNQFTGKTIIALDGGYSSVKGVSGNRTFIFPSYAKQVDENLQILGSLKPNDILFRDNTTGKSWAIGSLAENLMDRHDLEKTTDESLFTRYRYKSDVFKVIMSAGLAIGLLDTVANNDIYLQTGLPSTYKERDTKDLVAALSGDYDFSIKIGNEKYRTFKFTLAPEHINVIEQPQGTLLASAYDKTGTLLKDGQMILSSNSIIYDIGFGTEDIFVIRSGANVGHDTFTDTGMRAVFDATVKEINKRYPTDYKVFELQKYLEDGNMAYIDRDAEMPVTKNVDFESILRAKNKELCQVSIKRLLQEYDNLLDYKYLIVTGGTGESRYEQICDTLKGLSHLTVIRGNQNDESLPFAYSNVRGYYMLMYLNLMSEFTKSQRS